MDSKDRNQLFSAMHEGKPLKSYIKTILGREFVHVWDSMTNQPIGVILEGDPRKQDESCIWDVWSEQEDVFFRRMNSKDFASGILIEYKRSTEEPKRTIEASTDDELRALVNSPFLKLQHAMNSTESIALLFRIKNLAEEADKSEKIMRAIEARISEVQAKEYQTPEPTITEL